MKTKRTQSHGYGPRTDALVYEQSVTADYTRADWIRLALAALDQAGVSPASFTTAYQHGRGNEQRTLENLDAVCMECGIDCDTTYHCAACKASYWESPVCPDCQVKVGEPHSLLCVTNASRGGR